MTIFIIILIRSAVGQWVECQTANQVAQVRIPGSNPGQHQWIFLALGGSELT